MTKHKTKFKQSKNKKDKGLLEFLKDKYQVIAVVGIFAAIITYLSKFVLETRDSIIQNNLGWGIMFSYGIIIIIAGLLFIEASKKDYDVLTLFFCIALLFIVFSFYSYISSTFQKPFNDLVHIFLFFLPIFLSLYFLKKYKNPKLSWTIFSLIILIGLFIGIRIYPPLIKIYNFVMNHYFLAGIFTAFNLILILFSLVFLFKFLPNGYKSLKEKIKLWKNKKQNLNKLK